MSKEDKKMLDLWSLLLPHQLSNDEIIQHLKKVNLNHFKSLLKQCASFNFSIPVYLDIPSSSISNLNYECFILDLHENSFKSGKKRTP